MYLFVYIGISFSIELNVRLRLGQNSKPQSRVDWYTLDLYLRNMFPFILRATSYIFCSPLSFIPFLECNSSFVIIIWFKDVWLKRNLPDVIGRFNPVHGPRAIISKCCVETLPVSAFWLFKRNWKERASEPCAQTFEHCCVFCLILWTGLNFLP